MKSRILCSVLIAGCAVQLVGCGDGEFGADGLPTDPVANFKAFLPGEFERISQESPNSVLASDYSINVEKTNSLVSPLIGTCTLRIASTITVDDGAIRPFIEYTINYGWQDGKWVCTGGVGQVKGGDVVEDRSEYKTLGPTLEKFTGRKFKFEGSDGLIDMLKNGF